MVCANVFSYINRQNKRQCSGEFIITIYVIKLNAKYSKLIKIVRYNEIHGHQTTKENTFEIIKDEDLDIQ